MSKQLASPQGFSIKNDESLVQHNSINHSNFKNNLNNSVSQESDHNRHQSIEFREFNEVLSSQRGKSSCNGEISEHGLIRAIQQMGIDVFMFTESQNDAYKDIKPRDVI